MKLLPVSLVDLHVAVEFLQLLLQQLQVGVDKAELQSHRLLHLVVGRGPASTKARWTFSREQRPSLGFCDCD